MEKVSPINPEVANSTKTAPTAVAGTEPKRVVTGNTSLASIKGIGHIQEDMNDFKTTGIYKDSQQGNAPADVSMRGQYYEMRQILEKKLVDLDSKELDLNTSFIYALEAITTRHEGTVTLLQKERLEVQKTVEDIKPLAEAIIAKLDEVLIHREVIDAQIEEAGRKHDQHKAQSTAHFNGELETLKKIRNATRLSYDALK